MPKTIIKTLFKKNPIADAAPRGSTPEEIKEAEETSMRRKVAKEKANTDAQDRASKDVLSARQKQDKRKKDFKGRAGTKGKKSIAGDVDGELPAAKASSTLGASDRKNLLGL